MPQHHIFACTPLSFPRYTIVAAGKAMIGTKSFFEKSDRNQSREKRKVGEFLGYYSETQGLIHAPQQTVLKLPLWREGRD